MSGNGADDLARLADRVGCAWHTDAPGNPKTSLLAPLSALALLRRLSEAVQVGA